MEVSDIYGVEHFAARFWSSVDKRAGADGCWFWTGKRKLTGYGIVGVRAWGKSRSMNTHRVAWILTYGSIEDDLRVLHSCDRRYPVGDRSYRLCCNPAHLWKGTQAENIADMYAKGREARGARSGRHTHPERFPSTRLTAEQVYQIRRLYDARAMTTDAIGRLFGVSGRTICVIGKRISWKHLTEMSA
jgi:hypothetical protein